MALSADDVGMAVRITKRMMSKGVVNAHHKQVQTIAGWFASHEQGDVKRVLDDMVSDREIPVRRKGRGTVTLTSMGAASDFLQDNGVDDPRTW